MNRISKSVAGLLIAGGAAGAWFGGHTFFRDAAFAQQQRDVELRLVVKRLCLLHFAFGEEAVE